MKHAFFALVAGSLVCAIGQAQTQTVRNSTLFAPNPAGFLLDPSGGPVPGGTWTPSLDDSLFAPPAAGGSTWTVAVSGGPLDFLLSPASGVLLCNPAIPAFTLGSAPATGGAVAYPLPVPDQCALIGSNWCTQGVLFDPAVGVRFTNAIDIGIGGGPAGLYSVSNGSAALRKIDTTTGATISAAIMTMPGFSIDGANALDKHPFTGELYVILEGSVSGPTPPGAAVRVKGKRKKSGGGAAPVGPADGGPTVRALATVCPSSGAATLVGVTGDFFAGIAFDGTGTLWAVTGDGGNVPESLFTIDTTTGMETFVASLGNGDDGEMLAYNPVDGLLYHGSGNMSFAGTPCIFETIDPLNPTATPVSIPLPLPLNNDETNALSSFQPGIGAFYWGSGCCSIGTSDTLYTATVGGAGTAIGPLDHTPKGLAVLP